MYQSNTPEETEFFRAIASGDEARICDAISKNPAVLESFDYRNFGATPLTAASFSNRRAVVELLIELGADPNRKSDWEMGPWSPLHCAIFRGDIELAEFLLSQGASLDVHTAAGLGDCQSVSQLLDAEPGRVLEKGGDGCHPLHFAASIDVAKLLLDRGAEIDGRCVDHYSTPLQYLCTAHSEVARFLLSVGAQPDIFSSIICGDERSLDQLLEAEPNLIHARINQTFFPPGPEHDVHNILTFSVGLDATPLHAAAKGNRAPAVNQLVRCGLSPNIRGGYDQGTPLHTAAWGNSLVAAQALLENGVDIEARSGDIHNNTAAGWAIVAGSDSVFELLMDRGAQHHPWFLDDARDACHGRFDTVSNVLQERRRKILSRLS